MDDLSELDLAARSNLSPRGVSRYQQYKAELLADPPTCAGFSVEEILTGWIWDEIEAESAQCGQEDEQSDQQHCDESKPMMPLRERG